jgi:hypothetical protein
MDAKVATEPTAPAWSAVNVGTMTAGSTPLHAPHTAMVAPPDNAVRQKDGWDRHPFASAATEQAVRHRCNPPAPAASIDAVSVVVSASAYTSSGSWFVSLGCSGALSVRCF